MTAFALKVIDEVDNTNNAAPQYPEGPCNLRDMNLPIRTQKAVLGVIN